MVRTALVTSRVSLDPRSWLLLATLSCGASGTGTTPSGEQPGPSSVGPVDNGVSGGAGVDGTDDGSPTPPGVGTDPREGTPGDIPVVSNPGEVPPGSVPPPEAPVPAGTGFITLENLDRGVVAVPQGGGVYVGWRMFGYEYDRDEPARISYNLYRDGALIANVTDSTNFQDDAGTAQSTYSVRAVIDGVEGAASTPAAPWGQNFLRVPLQPPEGNYAAYDSSLGDVDGDGQYEIFTLWQPGNAQDNSLAGVTSDVFIDALRMDGTRLWRINLGPNIRAGEHYTQFVVIDADGDGRAEMAVKTAPGTKDGTDAFLSKGPAANDDDSIEHRNGEGRVLAGPEYFTVFEGLTGRELATAQYHALRGNNLDRDWGDDYGNRVDRFLATAAYLDETGLPSFVSARGYYERTTLGAWNWRNGELTQLWIFDSQQQPADAAGRPFTGQGAHSLSVANVDDDPQQEIIYGAMTVDHDGRGKCSTGMNHGDALHVSDFMPERAGIEVFMPTESTNRPHWTVRDGGDCTILLQSGQTGADVGRGAAADVVAGNGSAEFWASNGVRLRAFANDQEVAGPQPNSVNFLIWWDADELRELENGTSISKVGGGTLLSCAQCDDNGTSKSVPALVADLIGDWREEVIWREADNSALRIYTTTNVTSRRIYTLMHDPQYRVAISWQNVAYNQPPHPGFFIGEGMAPPPEPDMRVLARPAP